MKRWFAIALSGCMFAVFSCMPGGLAACPLCKDAYNDGTGASVASSFNPSIIFMIVITFAVFFSVAFRIWWAYHKRNGGQEMHLN